MYIKFNADSLKKSLSKVINESVKKDFVPKFKAEQTELLRKIYYPGYKAPFSSSVIEIDEYENQQEATEREILKDAVFPPLLKSNSVGWVYLAKDVNIRFEDVKL
jgi:hypothetical protein